MHDKGAWSIGKDRRQRLSCGSGLQPRSCALNDFYDFYAFYDFYDFYGLPLTAHCLLLTVYELTN